MAPTPVRRRTPPLSVRLEPGRESFTVLIGAMPAPHLPVVAPRTVPLTVPAVVPSQARLP